MCTRLTCMLSKVMSFMEEDVFATAKSVVCVSVELFTCIFVNLKSRFLLFYS